MDITVIPKKIHLVEYPDLAAVAECMAKQFDATHTYGNKKGKGQFFTPKKIARFMSGLFNIRSGNIRLLDPGAGVGILIAAFCERLLEQQYPINLVVDAYENDTSLVSSLQKTLETCKVAFDNRKWKLEYHIHEVDFVLANPEYLKPSLFSRSNLNYYDFVIANPPYYKLNKAVPQSKVMSDFIEGQPNIYALFIALATSMTATNGELVFITPRSFCSGLYFKKFREWFLNSVNLDAIHIFNSRREVFDNILQESIIFKAKKTLDNSENPKILISTSQDKNFTDMSTLNVSSKLILKNNYIRIPTSLKSLNTLREIDRWTNTIYDFGLEISTGPVVAFRASQYFADDINDNAYPLIWMHNFEGINTVWPTNRKGKAKAIRYCSETTS
jgi:adenine-specific DNA-methyltransferase